MATRDPSAGQFGGVAENRSAVEVIPAGESAARSVTIAKSNNLSTVLSKNIAGIL